mmetsp:Transcript_31986/g.62952  ORF Transcript_31986/g.62952 Transcript_31986/m.62952 type:complete len:220 (-) Transcript_31986:26-685(-)
MELPTSPLDGTQVPPAYGGGAAKVALLALPEHELEQILEQRKATVAELQEEMRRLESRGNPEEGLEERLSTLERAFGDMGPGEYIKVKAPALRGIAEMIHQEHELVHQEALQHRHEHFTWLDEDHHEDALDLGHGEGGFLLGRGWMSNDKAWQAHEDKLNEARRGTFRQEEPVYVGHQSIAEAGVDPEALFVGPGGIGRTLRIRRPAAGSFWLEAPVGE